ncbi:MAG TPA: pyridoxamine 5'-phosphate oxidase family protein [Chthoniobacterales bacterium]|nr:pyridoxamine 5'-phosphate oxidase family protein [Chthoniobacterales bacterium]
MTSNVADNSRIGEIIEATEVGMLTTVQANGELRSRPMLCAGYDFDCLWFLAKESKPLVAEAIGNRVVNVAFANQKTRQYASVTGLAHLVEDEKLVQKLWRPKLVSWFPEGLQEPDLALLRVDIDHAEAWDADTRVWNRVKNKTGSSTRT